MARAPPSLLFSIHPGDFEAKAYRQGVAAVCPADHRRFGMGFGKLGQPVERAPARCPLISPPARAASAKRRTGLHDILRRRAPVHIIAGRPGMGGHDTGQRMYRRARAPRFLFERVEPERVHIRHRGDDRPAAQSGFMPSSA